MPDGAGARITPGAPSPASRLNHAIDLDRAGETGHARDLMRALALEWTDWDEPQCRLAESLRAHGERAAAADAWREVLAINGNREQALLARGAMAIEAGEPLLAQVPLLRCCGLAPANQDAWSSLGRAYLDSGQPVQALAAFSRAGQLAPRSIALARQLAAAALAAGSGPAGGCPAGGVECASPAQSRAAYRARPDPGPSGFARCRG